MPVTTCVFDAYGTLFDVAAAARLTAEQPGQERLAEVWPKLAADWRLKQLQSSADLQRDVIGHLVARERLQPVRIALPIGVVRLDLDGSGLALRHSVNSLVKAGDDLS